MAENAKLIFLFMAENDLIKNQSTEIITPATEEIAVLNLTEKLGFRLAHRMNLGAWKNLWTFCQRHIGSLWIKICTYNLMNVFGIENVKNEK